jgi:hypothetical protein
MRHNVTATTPGAAEPGGKKSLTERAVSELEKYAVITVYLWLLFALFGLHRELVQGHGISLWQQGFAIINALVFGKVILIGEALRLGKGQERHVLARAVLLKSLVFAILLVAFHMFEEAIRALFKSEPLSTVVAQFGGSLAGIAAYGAIFFVVLIPFFAYEEAARVLGGRTLWDLFFRPHVEGFRLVEDQAKP